MLRAIGSFLCCVFIVFSKPGFCAVDQILNDNFFPNPAELNTVNEMQLIAGNVLINPVFRFEGVSYGMNGSAGSNVTNALPYLLSSYRFTDKFVMGINITPSGYGHLDWPIDSIVSQDTTQTELFYYRFGVQASCQFTERLAFGIGFNFADNAHLQLNFLIPGQGNQVNSVSGLNYVGDLGLYYKINAKNYLTVAGYTQVNTYGHGTSSTGTTVVNNLSLNITAAPVIYAGLEHFTDNGWFLEGKLYWSGWSIQKNIDFTNTTTGSYAVPTNWRDVWSFQVNTRYSAMDKLALIGSAIYETNPVPLATNAIGYPLAASGSLSAGLDITVQKELSAQIIYSYGAFLPNSPIDNANSVGMIKAHFQSAVLQLIYKV